MPNTQPMAVLLVINLLASTVMLLLSINRATGGAADFYPATIPTIVQAGLAALVAMVGLGAWRRRLLCLVISSAALGLLGLPALYASAQWPGGDDGGGFGWLIIIGCGCVVSFVVAFATAIIGIGCGGSGGQKT